MKYSESIKPISYLKTHASEVIRDISENQKTMVITHNGEAKAVLQDVKVYEQTQESIAMLKILTLSSLKISDKDFKPATKSFKDLRSQIDKFKQEQDEI